MASATSEKGQRKQLARQAADKKSAIATVTLIMSTIDGRRWMYNELSAANMWNVDTGLDPYQMAYDKGLRNVGLRWLAAINTICPSMYVRMMEEATNIKLDIEDSEDDRADD